MNILAVKIEIPYAVDVRSTDDTLTVDLSDGRTISAPLGWYPRLEHAGAEERANWRLIGKGQGIHWEDIDEDISVEGILAGKPSGESQESFKKWLLSRASRPTTAGPRSALKILPHFERNWCAGIPPMPQVITRQAVPPCDSSGIPVKLFRRPTPASMRLETARLN